MNLEQIENVVELGAKANLEQVEDALDALEEIEEVEDPSINEYFKKLWLVLDDMRNVLLLEDQESDYYDDMSDSWASMNADYQLAVL